VANEFYVPGVDGTTAGDTNIGMPGAAPVPGAAGMQGNPDPRNITAPCVQQTPNPQVGATQVLGAVPDTASGLATGGIPHNAQPTNVNVQPGATSVLALLATGQLSLNQSNYGQGGFMPANAGSSPQNPQAGSVAVASVAAGAPSVPTFATPANMSGG
jgi:hypothetical protein